MQGDPPCNPEKKSCVSCRSFAAILHILFLLFLKTGVTQVLRGQFMSRLLVVLLFLVSGCHRHDEYLKPKLTASVQEGYLKKLPSVFEPLTSTEQASPWGHEYAIAMGFAGELDLYQAITAFKRATFLSPPPDRRLELEYSILICYYFGRRYHDVVYTYETSPLKTALPSFKAYQDLHIVIYDSYLQLDRPDMANRTLQQTSPETTQKLLLSGALIQADFPVLEKSTFTPVQELLAEYNAKKKSPTKAKTLNAFLPGAGYLYLGQKQSAFTALMLNSLFIWASVYSFQRGNIAAGAIFASFEAGWYFGGIYGAGQEAKFYNERLYERLATPMMTENRLFPLLMIRYAF
jgi:hypothetical protein